MAEAELLGIKEIRRVNLIVSHNVVLAIPFPRTSFGRLQPPFALLRLPGLVPHNVLYDTSWPNGVKEPLPEVGGLVKGSYPQL